MCCSSPFRFLILLHSLRCQDLAGMGQLSHVIYTRLSYIGLYQYLCFEKIIPTLNQAVVYLNHQSALISSLTLYTLLQSWCDTFCCFSHNRWLFYFNPKICEVKLIELFDGLASIVKLMHDINGCCPFFDALMSGFTDWLVLYPEMIDISCENDSLATFNFGPLSQVSVALIVVHWLTLTLLAIVTFLRLLMSIVTFFEAHSPKWSRMSNL